MSDKIEKMLKEYETMKSSVESMETKLIADLLTRLESKSSEDIQKIVTIPSDVNFRKAVDQYKMLYPGYTILLATKEGNFALLGSITSSAKTIAAKLGLK
ncbi:TPA: hypothetical protein DEP21_05220 [Patescibacteria group bacterium]|nr:hypothetical protein [Candidatus Gracilibacteria bacterium]